MGQTDRSVAVVRDALAEYFTLPLFFGQLSPSQNYFTTKVPPTHTRIIKHIHVSLQLTLVHKIRKYNLVTS